MKSDKALLARRAGSGFVDWAIEFGGGLLGSYFGALVAALMVAMKDGPPEQMQSSIWNGFGFGFVFWILAVSFINRVLIQGLSRASIGKKVFNLELISSSGPLTWTKVMKRWVLSFASLSFAGAGYAFALLDKEGRAFHDVIAHTDIVPLYEGKSMSIEYREERVFTMQEIKQMMVLSNLQAERQTATIIRLPVRERFAATGTDASKVVLNENVSIAPVIELKNATEEDETPVKKAA